MTVTARSESSETSPTTGSQRSILFVFLSLMLTMLLAWQSQRRCVSKSMVTTKPCGTLKTAFRCCKLVKVR